MLRHGTGPHARHLILLRVADEQSQTMGATPNSVRVSKYQFISLPLAAGDRVGAIDRDLYDADRGLWTATIAVVRFR